MTWQAQLGIAAGKALLGGILGSSERKAEEKRAFQQRAMALVDQRKQFKRLRNAAELGGFNPLTVLGAHPGAGGLSASSSGVPPLASNAHLSGFIQDVGAVLSSEVEQNRAAKEATKERAKIEAERLAAGAAGPVTSRTHAVRLGPAVTRPSGNRSNEVVRAAPSLTMGPGGLHGPFDAWEVGRPVDDPAGPKREADMADSIREQHVGPLVQTFTRPDGSVVKIKVGPDPEEIAAGVAMDKGPELWDKLAGEWQRWEAFGPVRFGLGVLRKAYSVDRAMSRYVNNPPRKDAHVKKREAEWKNRPAAQDLKNNPYIGGF